MLLMLAVGILLRFVTPAFEYNWRTWRDVFRVHDFDETAFFLFSAESGVVFEA